MLRWFEHSQVYHPDRILAATGAELGRPFEDVRFKASDGIELNGWFFPASTNSNRPRLAVLVCHGNAGNISHRLDKLLILRRAGAAVLLFDYRGYGRSSGKPDEQGTYLDAETAYLWLTEGQNIPAQDIVVHGESLGGAVALELALRRRVKGLILESAFTSTVDMGRLMFPFLPVNRIVRFRYDNLAKIGKLACRTLVMHSPEDDIVPYDMGQRLFAAAPQPKTFCELTGLHNDGFLDSGPVYEQAITRFLSS